MLIAALVPCGLVHAATALEGEVRRLAVDVIPRETGKWKAGLVPFLNTAGGGIHLIDDPGGLLSHLRVTTGQPAVVLGLFGTSDTHTLSAIPAQSIR